MTKYLDSKYINLISSRLERFVWKKKGLAVCRCPLCGDSKKKTTKARFYFFEHKNSFFVKCHNCGFASAFSFFLEKMDSFLFREYSTERFRDRMSEKINEEDSNMLSLFKNVFRKPSPKVDSHLKNLPKISDLPSNHIAREFVEQRKIPRKHWGILHYTDDFGSWMRKVDPDSLPMGKEKRLVIPFFNSHGDMVAAQGRILSHHGESNARKTVRYITVKADKSIERLWYGLWRCDPTKKVYVVEGPLDSLFIPNSVAMMGAAALKEVHPRLQDSNMVFVLDNEPRNPQIVLLNEKLIDMGKTVCIWPDSIKQKDINDMIYSKSAEEIQGIIDDNSCNGLEARLRLQNWRKS
jgi:hypothetical protein